jgi:hypothetical protein
MVKYDYDKRIYMRQDQKEMTAKNLLWKLDTYGPVTAALRGMAEDQKLNHLFYGAIVLGPSHYLGSNKGESLVWPQVIAAPQGANANEAGDLEAVLFECGREVAVTVSLRGREINIQRHETGSPAYQKPLWQAARMNGEGFLGSWGVEKDLREGPFVLKPYGSLEYVRSLVLPQERLQSS